MIRSAYTNLTLITYPALWLPLLTREERSQTIRDALNKHTQRCCPLRDSRSYIHPRISS